MKPTRLLIIITSLLIATASLKAQDRKLHSFVIGFYNLENLFDTIDDPNKNDEQYLPNGDNAWGTMKYTNKLKKMSYAISQFPKNLAVLGVSEVENINVLEDLVKEPSITDRDLRPILIEGPDRRGVDVGLLYNPKLFKPTNVTNTRVRTEIENFITRDQLCVSGILDGEEIHIIVLHWPSRGGGLKRSNPRRADAALTTKHICDSLYAANPNAKIIVMGDLNDNPTDASLVQHLGAKGTKEETSNGQLFNPATALFKKGIGSLGYQDQWSLFDQILVSKPLIGDDRNELCFWKMEIFNKDFLKQHEGSYRGYPLRTHSGGVWTNGYSDHFPSMIWLVKYAK